MKKYPRFLAVVETLWVPVGADCGLCEGQGWEKVRVERTRWGWKLKEWTEARGVWESRRVIARK